MHNQFNDSEFCIHSLFCAEGDYIIHLFVYTPMEYEGNKKIEEFFDLVKIKEESKE